MISLILWGVAIPAAFFTLPRPVSSLPIDSPPASDRDISPFQSFKDCLVCFDTRGIALGIPGILLLTFALTSANTVGWGAVQIIISLIIAVLLLVVFSLHEHMAPHAILAPYLFRSPSFNVTLVLAVNIYAVRQSCAYFLTVELQSFGNSPIQISVLFIPLGISPLN